MRRRAPSPRLAFAAGAVISAALGGDAQAGAADAEATSYAIDDPAAEVPRVTAPGDPAGSDLRAVPASAITAAAMPATSATDELGASVSAPDAEVTATAEATVGDETIVVVDSPPPGAHAEVSREVLERAEHDDIHKVLALVPGVYVREEDGYGLRPNIGMRGAAAERSAKVALLEDGVLIAPAPYSAPAAYYFPLVTRMSRVEVLKGPAAIVHGPNTVGGAVNLIGEPIPGERSAYLDLAGGSHRYGKINARAADRGSLGPVHWGAMAEYVKIRTDGFKELDDGGPTGFDKDDVQVSLRGASAPTARVYHQVDARVGYGHEVSNETYTGLSQADFEANPQRRYLATQDDRMRWNHWRYRLAHRLELGPRLSVETTAYRHDFHRVWGKVDAFVGMRDFAGLLAAPDVGRNRDFYRVLTGEEDTSGDQDQLIRGTNDRTFVSEGVQSVARVRASLGPTEHKVDAGVRVHFDRAHRKRHEDAYAMVQRELVRTARARVEALDTTAETLAVSVHGQDTVRWKGLEVTAGTRVEILNPRFVDHLKGTRNDVATYPVIIPGGGVSYALTSALSVLAGVHRGFVPVAPSASDEVDPESSINVEAGARWHDDRVRADLIGFFSDYSNLKNSCSYSTGCVSEQEGMEFNAGRVHVGGLEASAAIAPALTPSLQLPVEASYTLTKSAFQSNFKSEFAGWGEVFEGDELPYLPVHQASLGTSLVAPRWEVGSTLRWHGASRDRPGQGDIADAARIDALFTINLDAHVRLGRWGEVYATCDNVLDEQVIVSRRPYGPRPNAPRLFVLGYKARL